MIIATLSYYRPCSKEEPHHRFTARDTDWTARGLKEAVDIRKTGAHSMNRNGGHDQLPELYSKLLVKKTSPFVTNSVVHQH